MAAKVSVIGGGIGGLAAAALLARDGHQVTLFEKNATLGGVCDRFSRDGFIFDTGPSWYVMPKLFEYFFDALGENIADHLELIRLSPACRLFFGGFSRHTDLFSDLSKDLAAFASLEPGSMEAVKRYCARGKKQYEFIASHIVREDRESLLDYAKLVFEKGGRDLGFLSTMDREISRIAKTPELQAALHYPTMFLGTAPWRVPAFFRFLNYSVFEHGVWHPKGGIYKIVEALTALGRKHGVVHRTGAQVRSLHIERGRAAGVVLDNETHLSDIVISGIDRHYTEERLLPPRYREYEKFFAEKAEPSYSVLLILLGIGEKLPELAHHNFFFAKDWRRQFHDIDRGALSADPSFYVNVPSVTDPACAPAGMENVYVLVPIPANIGLSREDMDRCGDGVLRKLSAAAPGLKRAIFEKRFYPRDFAERYNLFRGSAFGLSHTLFQSGPFRPRHRSRKLKGLYFVGATTNPGIGMPTCLVSAIQLSKEIGKMGP